MDRRLIDYLPPVLHGVLEFQAINGANEPEIILAWDALDRVLDNQFLDSADEIGVAVWEGELALYPKGADTLGTRKLRIKAQQNLRPPFTLNWLRRWLDAQYGSLGASTVAYNPTNYMLTVRVPYAEDYDYTEAARLLAWAIPCNVVIDWSLAQHTEAAHQLYTGFAVRIGRHVDVTCEIPDTLDMTYLVDANRDILADELDNRLIDEEE